MRIENKLTKIILTEKEANALVKTLDIFEELEEEDAFDTSKCEITTEDDYFNTDYSVTQILDRIYSIGRRVLFK